MNPVHPSSKGRIDREEALRILCKHFPTIDGELRRNLALELSFAGSTARLTGYAGARGDSAALTEIEKTITRLASGWRELSPDAQWAFEQGAQSVGDSVGDQSYQLPISPEQMFKALRAGAARARRLDEAGDKTKANIRAAIIVRRCQEIWEAATGTPAPNFVSADSQREERGRFHDFARDVLDAADERISVESALRVWRVHVSSSRKNSC